MGEFAERQTGAGGSESAGIRDIAKPLFEAKGWMKFLGVLMIIYGALVACTLVGIVFAWIPIWLGILLFSAGTKANEAFRSGNAAELVAGLGKIKTFFMIYGILALIGVAVTIIMMLVWGATIFALVAGGGIEALKGLPM
ncbi:MAG: DUF5362 domain-containing protein [Candidatus Eisenbacteria bacterium]|nr:DUF5362 domain-containing protein [Candidatus Eisenbacteria bacterium]